MDSNPYKSPESVEGSPGPDRSSTRGRPLWVGCAISFSAGFLAAWLIWALLSGVSQGVEAWDTRGTYDYSLFAAGFLVALLFPRGWLLGMLGIYLGQVAYLELWYGPGMPAGDPRIFPSFIGVALFGLWMPLWGALLAYLGWLGFSRFFRGRSA